MKHPHSVISVPLAIAAVTLAACAPLPPSTVAERLDTGTGTTVTALPKPVQLFAERGRVVVPDPFAYLGPFETNQMGSRTLYLWVSVPQPGAPLELPRVLCDDEPLELSEVEDDLASLGLSKPPYPAPTPWSAEWYFALPEPALRCLADASRISVEAGTAQSEPEPYTAEGPELPVHLKQFAARTTP